MLEQHPWEKAIAGLIQVQQSHQIIIGEILAIHDPARTTVLLDPPATGIAPRVIELLLAAAPVEIIYVSCNPATLARDLGALGAAYRIKAVTPLDMFPQTAEIEVVAELLLAGS